VIDVGCGTGWMSYWIKKYGFEKITAVDNGEWKTFEYLPFVKKIYATQVDLKKYDLVLMSWPPYNSPFAFQILRLIGDRQHLLYIGEDSDGCTGDSDFHLLCDKTLTLNWILTSQLCQNFISFRGIHDRPVLFQKILNKDARAIDF